MMKRRRMSACDRVQFRTKGGLSPGVFRAVGVMNYYLAQSLLTLVRGGANEEHYYVGHPR